MNTHLTTMDNKKIKNNSNLGPVHIYTYTYIYETHVKDCKEKF